MPLSKPVWLVHIVDSYSLERMSIHLNWEGEFVMGVSYIAHSHLCCCCSYGRRKKKEIFCWHVLHR